MELVKASDKLELFFLCSLPPPSPFFFGGRGGITWVARMRFILDLFSIVLLRRESNSICLHIGSHICEPVLCAHIIAVVFAPSYNSTVKSTDPNGCVGFCTVPLLLFYLMTFVQN